MSTQLELTMSSGTVVTVDVEAFSLKRTAASKSLEWTDATSRKSRRLVSVNLDHVDAIVEVLA